MVSTSMKADWSNDELNLILSLHSSTLIRLAEYDEAQNQDGFAGRIETNIEEEG